VWSCSAIQQLFGGGSYGQLAGVWFDLDGGLRVGSLGAREPGYGPDGPRPRHVTYGYDDEGALVRVPRRPPQPGGSAGTRPTKRGNCSTPRTPILSAMSTR
jgi:hypothetical protein